MKNIIGEQAFEHRIYWSRGQRVMLDADLAELYRVTTKNLNKAVKRNRIRFPPDFMFQLTALDLETLRFQFGTSRWGGRRYRPYVFTEQGIAMLSSVLHSERAALVNIAIMRAFVRLRQILASDKDLAKRVEKLERKADVHDVDIRLLIADVRKLLNQPAPDVPLHPIHPVKGFGKE